MPWKLSDGSIKAKLDSWQGRGQGTEGVGAGWELSKERGQDTGS